MTAISNLDPRTPSVRRRTLRWSHIEGGLYGFMVGASETFAVYYALKQKLSSHEVAAVTLLPVLVGAIGNWLIPQFVTSKHLKISILFLVALQLLGLAGLFLATQQAHPFIWILVSLQLYFVGGMSAGPIWIDWISGWLPQDRMGRYLSRRNSFISAMTLGSYLLIALLIFNKESSFIFSIVFGCAFIARFLSFVFLSFQRNPPAYVFHRAPAPLPPSQVWKIKPILLVLIFTSFYRFTSNFAAPYFLTYILDEVHVNVLVYALLTAVPFFGRALFLSRWGELSRTYRPIIGLQIALFAIGFAPLIWSLSKSSTVLGLSEFGEGIFWGCYELYTVLIFQSYAPRNARGLIGLHLACTNLAALGGAYVGSFLFKAGFHYEEVFRFSFGARIAAVLLFCLATLRISQLQVKLKAYREFITAILSIRGTKGV